MNYLLLILGVVIFVVTINDLISTTFSPNGAGFFTTVITQSIYALFRKMCLKFKWMNLFEKVGIIIIVLIILFWYLSIWLGSSLIFSADSTSVVESQNQEYATTLEQFYYTGFTLTTLGVGDFKASSDGWRIFTVFLSLTGFILITTGISYMIPALSAVVEKRKLGSYVSILGTSPQAILEHHWQDDFNVLESHFVTLTEMIIKHNQQMLAYPVIYCFYTTNSRKAAVLNIARLDEALSIILKLVPDEKRPSRQSMNPLRNAITDFIQIQQKYFTHLEAGEPGLPEVNQLLEAGIPLKDNYADLPEAYQDLRERRTELRILLRDQGRDFHNIYDEMRGYETE